MSVDTPARERARRILREWREIADERDPRILEAIKAGMPKTEIHLITGVARSTIDDIIERSNAECQPPQSRIRLR